MATIEERYEVIVRHHVIEREPEHKSVKSRRYNIYQRVFEKGDSAAVIESVETALNSRR